MYSTDNEGRLVPQFQADLLTPLFPDRYSYLLKGGGNSWNEILCDSYLDRNTELFEYPANARTMAKLCFGSVWFDEV